MDHATTPYRNRRLVNALPFITARRCTTFIFARCTVLAVALLAGMAVPALADFRICNNTGSKVGVAIGYKDTEGWVTEGWWNITARTCETLLDGLLVSRYYYIYAVDYDRGGEWSGRAYMCTRDKEFTIRGIKNCLARGYDRTGFFEVDTREQRSWTLQLTENAESAPERPLLPLGPPRLPSAGAQPPPGSPPPGAPPAPEGHKR